MRPHAPKTAALSAFDAGALSPARRAQVEKHLSECEVCSKELAKIRLWSRESARIRAQKVVPVDFAKMELALAREAKAQAKTASSERSNRKLVPMLWPVAVAAAALLTLGLDRLMEPGPSVAPSPLVAAGDGPPLAPVTAEVVLVAGDVALRGREERPRVGERLATPAVIDVATGAAHLAVSAGPSGRGSSGGGVAVAALEDTTLSLLESDEARAELELVRGSVAVRSATGEGFHSTRRVVVLAAGYVIDAEVAVFDVELPTEGPAAVVVSVHEGRVRVTGRGEALDLDAPARFAPPTRLSSPVGTSRAPSLATPSLDAGGAPVRIDRAGVARWALPDGSEVEGRALSLLVPPGPLHLVAFDELGRSMPLDYVVTESGLVDEGAPLTPSAPSVAGYLEREVIREVIQPSLARIQRCYNLALRLRPDLGAARMSLRVTLSPRGEVVRTRIEGSEVPESLQACVASEAAAWSFPPPRGPMSFDVPMAFSAMGGR